MTTLLSIDPAADDPVSTTGWAIGYYNGVTPLTITDSGIIDRGFQGFSDSAYDGGSMLPVLEEVDIVICEDYKVFNSFGDPSPLKIIGVVQFLRPDTVLQLPSGKNTMVPDSFLKEQGHWHTKANGGGHHRDRTEAIRHAYYYLVRQKHLPTLKLLSPP